MLVAKRGLGDCFVPGAAIGSQSRTGPSATLKGSQIAGLTARDKSNRVVVEGGEPASVGYASTAGS